MINQDKLSQVFDILGISKSKLNTTLSSDEIVKLNHVFSSLRKLPNTLNKYRAYHAALDGNTGRIYFLSNYSSTVLALRDVFNLWAKYNIFVSDKESLGTPFFKVVGNANSNDYMFYYFNRTSYNFKKSIGDLTAHEIYRFKLVQEKACALDILHKEISNKITTLTKDIPLQYYIYHEKYKQAKEIISNNVIVDDSLLYPLVSGYADIRGIDIVESAKEIIFNTESTNYTLSNIENLRLKYTKKIRDGETIECLEFIIKELEKELFEYSNL